jgi:hypothetical protein
MSNFNQTAKALEMYYSDYGQYVPCHPAWSIGDEDDYAHKWCGTNSPYKPYADNTPQFGYQCDMGGRYSDPKNGQAIGAMPWSLTYWSTVAGGPLGRSFWECIAYQSDYSGGLTTHGSWAAGNLNAAPVGLGLLAVCGYSPDVAVFYCPSASNMPEPAWCYADLDPTNKNPGENLWINDPTYISNLPELKRIGGRDGYALTRGDFTNVGNFGQYYSEKPIFCNYRYRNAVIFPFDGHRSYHDSMGATSPPWLTPLYDTKPLVYVENKKPAPCFKTTKFLGGRCVAMDTCTRFSGDRTHTAVGSANPYYLRPGWGWYAHRDGYNCLYGDGHGQWFGDGDQRVLYFSENTSQYSSTWAQSYNIYGGLISWSDSATNHYWARLWHVFDNAVGIDLP